MGFVKVGLEEGGSLRERNRRAEIYALGPVPEGSPYAPAASSDGLLFTREQRKAVNDIDGLTEAQHREAGTRATLRLGLHEGSSFNAHGLITRTGLIALQPHLQADIAQRLAD